MRRASGSSAASDEARHARLKTLADSINETARMARATLVLLLAAALYLGFTLLSSTDKNLLLNAQVAMPVLPVGFGMALDKSYIFGPPIFLYLHVQVLFLLSVLYRQIQGFETALVQELSGISHSRRMRREYWSLLSAFAFVQLFRRGGHFPYISRLLAWISIEAIPLSLLFIVALSFVRYQSEWITNSHHVIFLLDLFSIIWFNSLGLGRYIRSIWNNLRRCIRSIWNNLRRCIRSIWNNLRRCIRSIWNNPSRWRPSRCNWQRFGEGRISVLAATRRSIRAVLASIKAVILTSFGTVIWTLLRIVIWTGPRLVVAGAATLLLFEAHPPSLDIGSVEEIAQEKFAQEKNSGKYKSKQDAFQKEMEEMRNRIWRTGDESTDGTDDNAEDDKTWQSESLPDFFRKIWQHEEFRQAMWEAVLEEAVLTMKLSTLTMWEAVLKKNINALDIGPCEWWGACRYLSVKDLWLVSTRPVDVPVPKIHESDESNSDPIEWSSLNELSLTGRNLRFADFRSAKLQGVNLEDAELQGANLEDVNLQNANLVGAKMEGALLSGAKLQYADLSEAELRSANLQQAMLQNASLNNARLFKTYLKDAQLQHAELVETKLQHVNMKDTQMDGASLWGAELENANLQGARLRGASLGYVESTGADLNDAQLQGAKLRRASFKDMKFEKMQLEGVDLRDAKIQCESCEPKSWELAWMHNTSINMTKYTTRFDEDDVKNMPHTEWVKAWAKWTADFACENEYTGYSSVKRWTSDDPLSGLKDQIGPEKLDRIKKRILRHILSELRLREKNDQCPGLRMIPDGGWRIPDSRWREVWRDDD